MALEGGVDVHSLFEDHSRVSETCEYQIERSLTHMSKWRDYLIEFEWSVPGVEEENIERRVWSFRRFEIYFISKISVTEPFMFTLPSSCFDWNTVEKDVKHQTIHPTISRMIILQHV